MRAGIIGAGWWASRHAQALQTLAGFRVEAVYQPNAASAQAFTRDHGGRVVSEVGALLHDPRVDAVLVAAPHREHADLAVQVLEAGKPLLLEKPVGITPDETRRVLACIERTGVPCLVGFTSHYFPGFRAARALLARGDLGRPLAGQGVFQKLWIEHNRRPWHLDRDQGGGMLLTAGIHVVDRLMWLMDRRVASVAASVGTHLHDQNADDLASLFLRMEGGAAGLVGSFGYALGGPLNTTHILCERGGLRVGAEHLEVATQGDWAPMPLDPVEDVTLHALGLEWLDLAAWVREGRVPQVTPKFAAQVMQVVFAAEESARMEREVALTEA
ncbi:Gfo/Idh/MocA family oxidoreductase (plasmid) [Deinococcus metallilatus]|uniref:Dehydrogenase n=1 Tax=Deinococcus metallilatus TaxID=1211322 RepID=A0ABR6MYK0_9DEIO|nr:Gfo/Idh/MocA family oxidoreductase [Deinococcus metallilatus]MBB5296961.1 putative dehydrogenase [Deinococcus metallilatus]QBY06671.1 Gfo/Idh/MocA family oxidoreductase [Deinococcus metallilatus]GMA15140.1 hypothetical protein GCM10025871_14710 [Deinococcus metallilatus]